MIELKKLDEQPFRRVMETLTRIGVYSKDKKSFLQKCFIVSFYGKDYLVNYKEVLDKEISDFDDAYVNTVALMLKRWGIAEPLNFDENTAVTLPHITVISREKANGVKLETQIKQQHLIDFITKQKVNSVEAEDSN
jgi:hypothetical protein